MDKKKKKRSPLHERPLRSAGQSLNDEIDQTIENGILEPFLLSFTFIVVAVITWYQLIVKTFINPIIISIIAIIVTIYAAIKIIRTRRRMESLKLARDGEKIVAEIIDILKKEGDVVFHDIIGNNFNIDHVILSRHGIYAIETKTYSKPSRGDQSVQFTGKKLLVNGYEPDRDPIKQATALSRWLEREINASTGKHFPVHPVVVFPGWFVEPMPKDANVWVLNPLALPKFIINEPIIISDTDLCLVAYHLSRLIRSEKK